MDCKICGCRAEMQESIHTLVAYGHREDVNGYFHDHDENCITETWKCINGHKFYCRGIHHCWCGWNSQYPKKHFVKYKRRRSSKGYAFKCGHAVITNPEWVMNMIKKDGVNS